ncbi:hypothetical protein [Tardiphaga sp. 619_E2_N8_5]|jgi:hypothetical protein|uniref:hypothetical protein n=1 Tax=unclassified Tardiphaga TaxID=2631404 RepID=UPI003F24A401
MIPTTQTRVFRTYFTIAILATAAGLGASTSAMARLTLTPPSARFAQATPPLQSTPGAENKPSAPAEPATTGQRPQETPPQPARPDAEARDAGAKPALPPAPAEKTAPPITMK